MKKRIRRKLHKQYLGDLVYEISISAYWRQKLLRGAEARVLINKDCMEIPWDLRSRIKQLDLSYYVSVVPYSKTTGWEDWGENYSYFKFESVEFPTVQSYSVNNRNAL